jgi:hypothetical protein
MPTQHEHDDIEMLCGAVVALQVSVGGADEAGGEVGVVGLGGGGGGGGADAMAAWAERVAHMQGESIEYYGLQGYT